MSETQTLPRTGALLSVENVETYYGNIRALSGVSVHADAGEIVTLIGANGAGKSTLMMTIFGMPRARKGRVMFAGQDITQLPTHEPHIPAHDCAGKPADGCQPRQSGVL
jgi:branched-chain amino acid transport system ATP-binding protein